ncbi:ML domain-containing protein [Phycomyces blakesleeanus]|uniref:Phosphatidylglycerol/phosphatidylinositol transfer protein n=2 Tax=Phycomyces blakesleeanus TaxID=4837 RepID=A0A167KF43_PHYB8|nr:hypothetical protein PHYBLDRAFT_173863 [Phycomyces blakesleeanus NRRL 1555(-)]OAD67949.1 hypothetical protein PHYBLDRAFT_173863 [Phycomyces blakesleeanus NRRL 1555(-)]|eukprot:XP_018285989.1 hypothetical protein PHYBLDRAFT_173863 [Phycomyces blakesleeanus NRRL 1555(-)]
MKIAIYSLLLLALNSTIVSGFELDYFEQASSSHANPSKPSIIKDCGDKSYMVEIKDITLTPAVPVPGKEISVVATGHIKEKLLPGAYADVLVKVGDVDVLKKQYDLCQVMKDNKTNIQCPVKKGKVKFTHKVTIPKDIPKALFKVEVRAFDVNKKKLACLNLAVDFKNPENTFYDL